MPAVQAMGTTQNFGQFSVRPTIYRFSQGKTFAPNFLLKYSGAKFALRRPPRGEAYSCCRNFSILLYMYRSERTGAHQCLYRVLFSLFRRQRPHKSSTCALQALPYGRRSKAKILPRMISAVLKVRRSCFALRGPPYGNGLNYIISSLVLFVQEALNGWNMPSIVYVTVPSLPCTVPSLICGLWPCVELLEGERMRFNLLVKDLSCCAERMACSPSTFFLTFLTQTFVLCKYVCLQASALHILKWHVV